MIRRCYNRNHISFQYYGAKGVQVCERWRSSFAAFLADLGRRPTKEHTLDRIDPAGDYEPGNVRWATKIEQANNRRVMKAPTCKICHFPHWTHEPHNFTGVRISSGAKLAPGAQIARDAAVAIAHKEAQRVERVRVRAAVSRVTRARSNGGAGDNAERAHTRAAARAPRSNVAPTKQRWDRKAYNAWQKVYMRRYRREHRR